MFNFGHRDRLEPLLHHLVEATTCFVPSTVVNEVKPEKKLDYEKFCEQYFEIISLSISSEDETLLRELIQTLDEGEIDVILLTRQRKGVAVIDERHARQRAKALGIAVIGTIGILRKGIELGWMTSDDAMASLRLLRQNGFSIPKIEEGDTFDRYIAKMT